MTCLFVLFVIVVLILSFTLPPHTDPGVEVVEPGVAIVHEGETLILWVPLGKSSTKFSFTYENDTVIGSSFLYHDERTIHEGCETFRVSLFYTIDACREGENMRFEWTEFFLGVRIDR